MDLMQIIFFSKRPHIADIIQLCQDNYCCRPVNYSSLKIPNFLLLAKTQKPTNEITYFVKDFFLFAKFPFN